MKKLKQHQKSVIIAVLAIVLLVAVGFILSNTIGKAVYVDEQPTLIGTPGDPINLTKEGVLIFTAFPTETSWKIIAETQLKTFVESSEDVLSMMIELERTPETGVYSVAIFQTTDGDAGTDYNEYTQLIVRDTVFSGDDIDVYLNLADPYFDLKIKEETGQISIENSHFATDAQAKIMLHKNDSVQSPFPTIIMMSNNTFFSALVNTSSSNSPPIISIGFSDPSFVLSGQENNIPKKSSWANFSWQTTNGAAAKLLDVQAQVGSLISHRYYTLAIAGLLYELSDPQHPRLNITVQGADALMKAEFGATTQLQPFALPCKPKPAKTSKEFMAAHSGIERMYAYTGDVPKITYRKTGSIGGDDFALEPFQGYYVKLARASALAINIGCEMESITPVRGLAAVTPNLGSVQRTNTLSRGWNLVSIPGTIPYRLEDLAGTGRYELFDCGWNNRCSKVNANSVLVPGKVYWVNTPSDLTMRYVVE